MDAHDALAVAPTSSATCAGSSRAPRFWIAFERLRQRIVNGGRNLRRNPPNARSNSYEWRKHCRGLYQTPVHCCNDRRGTNMVRKVRTRRGELWVRTATISSVHVSLGCHVTRMVSTTITSGTTGFVVNSALIIDIRWPQNSRVPHRSVAQQ
jgi:hypothetical protein